uniref:Uncharacterized protein n=1 Tax=Glossina brevipalpis TaxID=37001 RepID=A0A1A9X207_9MUSC
MYKANVSTLFVSRFKTRKPSIFGIIKRIHILSNPAKMQKVNKILNAIHLNLTISNGLSFAFSIYLGLVMGVRVNFAIDFKVCANLYLSLAVLVAYPLRPISLPQNILPDLERPTHRIDKRLKDLKMLLSRDTIAANTTVKF